MTVALHPSSCFAYLHGNGVVQRVSSSYWRIVINFDNTLLLCRYSEYDEGFELDLQCLAI